jgi:hypothetical protein
MDARRSQTRARCSRWVAHDSADPNPRSESVLLVDERDKLADVYDLIGLVIKADYSRYRVFVS